MLEEGFIRSQRECFKDRCSKRSTKNWDPMNSSEAAINQDHKGFPPENRDQKKLEQEQESSPYSKMWDKSVSIFSLDGR